MNGRDPLGEQCTNTTFGNLKAVGGAALGWAGNKLVGFMDAGGRSTVILLDDLSPIDLGWVTENAREARRYNARVASNVSVAAERGQLTPVHVVGGATDRHVEAVASAKCSEDQAAASTVALLDLVTLRGALDVPMSGGRNMAPAVVTNTGAILPRAGNRTTASLMTPFILANTLDDSASDEMELRRHGEMPSPRPNRQSHHGVMSQWMRVHFTGYDPDQAPAILMSTESHTATFGVYNRWRARMKQSMGGVFDWKKVTEADMMKLSEEMFDAAGVSQRMRQDYWAWYARMKNKLRQ